jgi:hypothetical protein
MTNKGTIVEIVYDGNRTEVDLSKSVPFELLRKDYRWMTYIPAPLMRAVCLALGIYPTEIEHQLHMWDTWVFTSVSLKIDWIAWYAQDYYGGKKIATSTMPLSARLVALAIKSALKFKYPFFEWESFEDAEQLDLAPDKKEVLHEKKWMIDSIDGYRLSISKAKTSAQLTKVGQKLSQDESIWSSDKQMLKDLYVKQNKLIW